jgi:hypothetical protein
MERSNMNENLSIFYEIFERFSPSLYISTVAKQTFHFANKKSFIIILDFEVFIFTKYTNSEEREREKKTYQRIPYSEETIRNSSL